MGYFSLSKSFQDCTQGLVNAPRTDVSVIQCRDIKLQIHDSKVKPNCVWLLLYTYWGRKVRLPSIQLGHILPPCMILSSLWKKPHKDGSLSAIVFQIMLFKTCPIPGLGCRRINDKHVDCLLMLVHHMNELLNHCFFHTRYM